MVERARFLLDGRSQTAYADEMARVLQACIALLNVVDTRGAL